ncbi:MAG: hypothetical protein FWD73_08225 [Polyangiaceae bacterium]|nr:hypothetical protein [Polyangiaceae bacterium]
MQNWIYIYVNSKPGVVYRIFRIPDQQGVSFGRRMLQLEHLSKGYEWKQDDACRAAHNAYLCGDLTEDDTLSWDDVQKWVALWDQIGWPDDRW